MTTDYKLKKRSIMMSGRPRKYFKTTIISISIPEEIKNTLDEVAKELIGEVSEKMRMITFSDVELLQMARDEESKETKEKLHNQYKKSLRYLEKENYQTIKKIFHQHPQKIIILGKLTHIIGLPILLGVGMSRYDWRKFLLLDFLATIVKSAILISVGYYLAESWTRANDFISYLSWFGLLFLLIIIICFVIKKLVRNLWKN